MIAWIKRYLAEVRQGFTKEASEFDHLMSIAMGMPIWLSFAVIGWLLLDLITTN